MAETTADQRANARAQHDQIAAADQAERALTRGVAIGLPAVTLLGAITIGMLTSTGPAILVLAGGMLLAVIMFFWSSLRTLSGEAPLPPELVEAMASRRGRMDELSERKRMALRALKDLEHDHAVGKLDAKDYDELAHGFREQAKAILREMDDAIDPERARAEEIARAHLKRRGLLGDDAPAADASAKVNAPPDSSADMDDDADAAPAAAAVSAPGVAAGAAGATPATTPSTRQTCPKCGASNEPDATFCKACGTAMKREPVDASV